MDDAPSAADSGLPIRELAARITELAGHLNAANHRWLRLIAEFDRREGWSDGATHSCAHWLGWQCGIELGAAREKVRVAHALERLPLIDAAMARGQLSYSKVRALTRVATPGTEELLLNVALYGTAHHVEKLVRQFRRVQEVEELSREARQQTGRHLTYYHDEDGSLVLKVQLPAEAGALVLKALETAVRDLPLPPHPVDCEAGLDIPAGTSPRVLVEDLPPMSARRADALAVLAESYLKHGAEARQGGERQQIVVHVDQCALNDRSAGRCELEDGPAIPVETALRLACDASVVEIVEDARGERMDYGMAIDTLLMRARRERDVSAGRS